MPVIVIAATVYTMMLPNLYQSQARISVQEDAPPLDPFADQVDWEAAYNPYFLRTQFEIIQSKPVLYEVISRLNLQEEWRGEGEALPRDVALKILRNSVQVMQMRDTSLIVLSVRRTDPDEAAVIANELAEVYRDYRLDTAQDEAKRVIDKIYEAMQDQLVRVEAAENKVKQLRTELDISVTGGSEVDGVRLQQMERERLAALSEMQDQENLIKALSELEEKSVLELASYITFDEVVVGMVKQVEDIDVELSKLGEDYGANHPEVKRYRLQKEKLEEKLALRLKALRNGLQTDYELAEKRYQNLEQALTDIRSETKEFQSDEFRPFRIALAELENERLIYNELTKKHRMELIAFEVPRNPVEIIDIAEPNRRPVSPNLFLNVMISVGVAGFFGIAGGIMLGIGSRKSPPPLV